MVKLPDEVFQAFNNPKAGKTLATVREDGTPHIIQVGSAMAPNPEMIAFGAILMKETGKNLEAAKMGGKLVSVLVTQEMKSYQVHAKVKDYITSGPLFDKMNEVLKSIGLKAHGVWTLEPVEVWNQSASYEAGKRMA
ncbi:MAG: pyridoxamine 5'-phosphate oxidase family protein [Methanomassiliicoccales archaeon]